MHDSEIQAMKENCHEVWKDADGSIIRHYLRSVQYKGKKPGGVERTWVVIEQVVKAVDVMRKLTADARVEYNTDLLFIIVHGLKPGSHPSLKNVPNDWIAKFISHVNAHLVPSLNSPDYPAIPIDSFRPISTRMFRRTVAWHIANRPFGVVAGMIQYGHMSETMFEGYAGSSESGFRAEVEAERAFARKADIVELYEDWKRGISPAGPMSEELKDEFQHVREELDDFPGRIILDEGRREKMIASLSRRTPSV
jgi:hypothetical protein